MVSAENFIQNYTNGKLNEIYLIKSQKWKILITTGVGTMILRFKLNFNKKRRVTELSILMF